MKAHLPLALLLFAVVGAAGNFAPALAQDLNADQYIDGLPDSADEKAMLKRYVAAIRATFDLDTSNRSAVLQAFGELQNSAACVFQHYVRINDGATAKAINNKVHQLRLLTTDTPTRQYAFIRFFQAADFFDEKAVVPQAELRLKPPVCLSLF